MTHTAWFTFFCMILLFATMNSCNAPPSYEKIIQDSINSANQKLPRMTDRGVRFDKIELLPNKSVQFESTLIDHDSSTINVEALKESIKPILLDEARNEPAYKIIRDNKVTMVYLYKGKNGKELFKLIFDSSSYKK
jgi:hypothetical protein